MFMVMPQAGELVAALVAFDEPVQCWAFTSEISEVKNVRRARSTNPLQSRCMHDESTEFELHFLLQKAHYLPWAR